MKKEKNKGQSLPLHILKGEQEICQTVFLTEVVCTVLKVLRVNVFIIWKNIMRRFDQHIDKHDTHCEVCCCKPCKHGSDMEHVMLNFFQLQRSLPFATWVVGTRACGDLIPQCLSKRRCHTASATLGADFVGPTPILTLVAGLCAELPGQALLCFALALCRPCYVASLWPRAGPWWTSLRRSGTAPASWWSPCWCTTWCTTTSLLKAMSGGGTGSASASGMDVATTKDSYIPLFSGQPSDYNK